MALRGTLAFTTLAALATLAGLSRGARAQTPPEPPPPMPAPVVAPPAAPEPPPQEPKRDAPTKPEDVPAPPPTTGSAQEPAQAPALEEREDADESDEGVEETESTKPKRKKRRNVDEGIGIRVDFLAGGATLDTVAQGALVSGTRTFGNVVDSSRIDVATILLGVDYAVTPRLTLGARLPLISGGIESRTGLVTVQRRLFMAGNLELGALYTRPLSRSLGVEAGLTLAPPTSGGREAPLASEVAAEPTRQYDYESINRYYLARAADFTSGSQDSSLFEPGRLGIVPRIGVRGVAKRFRWSASMKMENLIATTKETPSRYVGEIVGTLRASYAVTRHIEPGVGLWTNVTYAGHEERKQNVLVLEPVVRFPFSHVLPYVGVVIPLAGRFTDEKVFGIRAGVQINF